MAGNSNPSELLTALLPDWHLLLQDWSASGRLTAAAQEALLLNGEPQALKELVAHWSSGVFTGIPPIVLLPSSSMPGAAGDEGEYFSALLSQIQSINPLDSHELDNDSIPIDVNNIQANAEAAIITVAPSSYGLTGIFTDAERLRISASGPWSSDSGMDWIINGRYWFSQNINFYASGDSFSPRLYSQQFNALSKRLLFRYLFIFLFGSGHIWSFKGFTASNWFYEDIVKW